MARPKIGSGADRYDRDQFTRGRCHILALVLGRGLNLPIVGFARQDNDGRTGVTHFMARSPDGLLWDAAGAWTATGAAKEYGQGEWEPRDFTREEVLALCGQGSGFVPPTKDERHEAAVFASIYLLPLLEAHSGVQPLGREQEPPRHPGP
jgi:hypothetical protein